MQICSLSFGAKINAIPSIHKFAGKNLLPADVKLDGYKAFIGGDVYTPSGKIIKQDLLFKDKKLVAIDDFNENTVTGKIDYVILNDETIAPAIFDEHIHGGYGISFHDSDEKEIRELLKKLAQKGVGGVLATTLPGAADQIRKQIKALNNIIKNPDKDSARLFGIHLEGPFLNPQKKGIHSIRDLMVPSIENYESFNPENVKMVTLAPELDEGYELTKYLQGLGVVVSAGHSLANAKQIIDSGINHVTHIFNAMAQMHHRIPTIANEGVNNPNITAELLADESSVIPSMMNMLMKIKPKDKLVLISDALPFAGMKTDFIMNKKLIHVDENYVPKDADGTLAGNMKFLPEIAKKLIEDTNLTFRNFIKYASINPARTFGFSDKFCIKENLEPIFTVWNNKKLIPEKTFIA